MDTASRTVKSDKRSQLSAFIKEAVQHEGIEPYSTPVCPSVHQVPIHTRYYCTLLLLAILATHSLATMRVTILPVSPTPVRGLNHLVMLRYKNIRDRSLLMETDGATRAFLSTSPLCPLDTMILFAKLPVSCNEEAGCLIDILPLV
ncbi:hypothetical protein CBL_13975 [Carabus blaptoides fortunei]